MKNNRLCKLKELSNDEIVKISLRFRSDEFGSSVINYRYDLELSLRECAKKIGISSATLNRIERKKCIPDLITYFKCCQWLKYPMEYFFKP